MKTAPLALALLVLAASLPAQARSPSRVEVHAFYSRALAMQRYYSVYLPPGYDESDEIYPVIYVLHGLHGLHGDWFSPEGGHLATYLDEAIRSGAVRPVIAVSPDGDSGYWTNHFRAVDRDYGDYVARDLMNEVDSAYRTISGRNGRAIAGVSMGGFGALSLALQHPQAYAAAVSLGGALFEAPPSHRRVYGRVWGRPADPEHWRATSPIELMRTLRPGDDVPRLFIECGDRDPLGFYPYAETAHRILEERRIPHVFRRSEGGTHSWETWRAVTGEWLRFIEEAWR